MRIAFTAPMKPLDDPVPSGDRTMGRLIVRALEQAGHTVEIATRFRAWRANATPAEQQGLERAALAEAEHVAGHWEKTGQRPDLFLTYHLYHKAPDWIGPALADRFALPYAVVEASRAPKRQAGDWSHGFAAADRALARADAVAALHRADAECLAAVVDGERLSVLAPFLDAAPYSGKLHRDTGSAAPVRLLAVGMMREGAKLASYRLLAEALAAVSDLPWTLSIAGDGPQRAEVEALFPAGRTTFLGAVPPEEMPAVYGSHDALVWPAIREAFGLVFLEAQAAGLPVVGGAAFGVPDIVAEEISGLLSPEGDASGFAGNLRRLIADPGLRLRLGQAGAAHIAKHHDLAAGAARLDGLLARAVRNHDRRVNGGRM